MELPTNGAKKKSLRQSFRADRKFLVQPVTWNHLIDSIEFKSATMIASYISYGDEPDTNGLNQTILESGKTLLLPRMRSDNFLDWVIWKGKIETLKRNKNIMEPIGDAIAPERIKILILCLCQHFKQITAEIEWVKVAVIMIARYRSSRDLKWR